MVKILFLLSLLSVSIGLGAEELKLADKMPAIKSVTIKENGAWTTFISGDEPREACTDFLLTKFDIQQFFKVARSATDREYHHDLEMSRCYVSGQAILQNGKEASWEIDRTRRGALWLPDGSIFYFYCGKCQNKAYYEDCDIDCIHGP